MLQLIHNFKPYTMKLPNYTVLYNIDCGDFIGTAREFFSSPIAANERYHMLKVTTRYCPTMRPFNLKQDAQFMGAVHGDIKQLAYSTT